MPSVGLLVIGRSVTNIEHGSFPGCSGEIINFSNIKITKGSEVTNIPNGFLIENYIFVNNDSVNTLIRTLKYVKDNRITLPENCNGEEYAIGNSVFKDYEYLKTIKIPNSVIAIGDSAFYKSGLNAVNIPNSVRSIGRRAFEGCTYLKPAIIGNSVTTIGEEAFYGCSSLTSLTIPNSVTSIGNYAFANCKALDEVNISDLSAWCRINFANLSANPVYYAEKIYLNGDLLTELVIPNNVTEIKGNAFYNYGRIVNLTIGDNVSTIGADAFKYCSALKKVTLGISVTDIGKDAFENCKSLVGVYVKNLTPPSINGNFAGMIYTSATLYVPQGSLSAYQTADVWKNFWDIQEHNATAIENIEESSPAFQITSSGIQFTATDGKAVAIYTTNGALVEKIDNYAGEKITLDKGVYVVRIGNNTMKVRL